MSQIQTIDEKILRELDEIHKNIREDLRTLLALIEMQYNTTNEKLGISLMIREELRESNDLILNNLSMYVSLNEKDIIKIMKILRHGIRSNELPQFVNEIDKIQQNKNNLFSLIDETARELRYHVLNLRNIIDKVEENLIRENKSVGDLYDIANKLLKPLFVEYLILLKESFIEIPEEILTKVLLLLYKKTPPS